MLALSKSDILFHAATQQAVASILETGLLRTSKPHPFDSKRVRYISFSRTLTGEYVQAVTKRGDIAVLRVDGKALGQRYRLEPYNFNRAKSREPGWAEAEERLLSDTATVSVSGCILQVLSIGENEQLRKLAQAASIPFVVYQSLPDMLRNRPTEEHATNMLGGWRSPVTKSPKLPITTDDWPDVNWDTVSQKLHVATLQAAARTLTDIWLTRNLLVRAEAEDRLPPALNLANARIVLPALMSTLPKTAERLSYVS